MSPPRGEVSATLFDGDGQAMLEAPSSLPPERTIDAWAAALASRRPCGWVGDGAARYREVIMARAGSGLRPDHDHDDAAIDVDPARPLAGAIGIIAAAAPDRAVRPPAPGPLHLRRSDAALAR